MRKGNTANARECALSVLVACRRNGAWADAALKAQLGKCALSAQDAALCSRIVYGVMQNELLLNWYLSAYCTQKLDHLQPPLSDILRIGAYQILFLDTVIDNARALPGYLNMTQGYDAASGTAASFSTLSIISTLAWGLGYFGMPHILLRFMAIREEKELNQSRRIATIWVVISMFIAVCIGIIGNSVTAAGKVPFLATSAESETIIIKLADLMSQHGVLPAVMAGIILSGILAATMSTADSQLLAAASSVSQDLMQHSFGIKMNQRTTMLAARATVIGIAIIGMVLAWDPNSSVFRVVSFAWAGFGAAFGPVMLFSLFWKRANKQGALAGMITGGAVVFIWKYLIAPMGGAWAIYELLPAFLAACIAIVIVSLATPAPEKAVTDTFDEICGK